jgi:pantoate--beta-alanine ligase
MSAPARCIETIAGLRAELDAARGRGASIGFVPTMGALHDGHLALIRAARDRDDVVVVSIFVNPTQFNAGQDLKKYPRDLPRDLALAEGAGADLVFAPPAAELYLPGASTWVDVEGLTEGLCGAARPGHFRGVCTVVTKLLNIVGPRRAYFGEKDAQQLAVIRRMVRDLDMRVEIVACPTVREADGLAMSSRNVRLTPQARAQAPVLYRSLTAARVALENGERDVERLKADICAALADADLAQIDYVEIVDAETLHPVTVVDRPCLVALAVFFGAVRLIDNVTVGVWDRSNGRQTATSA